MNINLLGRQSSAFFIVAALFGLVYLQGDAILGRLAMDLQYDDVVYAVDAAQRLGTIQRQGLGVFFSGLWSNPPHSPFATLLAMLAFSVGGLNEFALYASNILILLGMTAFLVNELRREGASNAVQWGGLIFLLVSPLASRLVCEFRPDLALGLATSIMVVWFVRGLVMGRSALVRAAAVMLGAALMVKPTFFAHTLSIAVGLVLLAVIAGMLKGRSQWVLNGIEVRDGGAFLLVGAAIALPYFVANGSHITKYFYSNTRGDAAAMWSIPESEPLSLTIRTMWEYVGVISGHHVLLAFCIGAFSAVVLFLRRDRSAFVTWLLLMVVASASFCIMVVGRHLNPYFLATFSWLVLFGSIFSCAAAIKGLEAKKWVSLAYAGIAALTGVTVFSNSGSVQRWNDPQGLRSNSMNVALVNSILSDYAASYGGEAVPTVWVPFAGTVNGDVMRWISLKSNRAITFVSDAFTSDFATLQANARKSDYLVLPNDVTAQISRNLPSTPALPHLMEWVVADPQFRPLSVLDTDTAYYVFRNTHSVGMDGRTVSVEGGIAFLDGFRGEEGPYPQMKLPRVRWMIKQNAKLCVVGSPGTHYRVSLGMRRGEAGALEVRDDKEMVLATRKLPRDGESMESMDFEMMAPSGRSCLRFVHVPDAPLTSDGLVLFSQLHFTRINPKTP